LEILERWHEDAKKESIWRKEQEYKMRIRALKSSDMEVSFSGDVEILLTLLTHPSDHSS
jgi:hypothetical protein